MRRYILVYTQSYMILSARYHPFYGTFGGHMEIYITAINLELNMKWEARIPDGSLVDREIWRNVIQGIEDDPTERFLNLFAPSIKAPFKAKCIKNNVELYCGRCVITISKSRFIKILDSIIQRIKIFNEELASKLLINDYWYH